MGRFWLEIGIGLMGVALWGQDSTKLSKAAIGGDVAKVQKALAAGEPVNAYDKWGWTPLGWAVFYRYPPVTELLLRHQADVNKPTVKAYSNIPVGSTPVVICAYYAQDELLATLLKAGADPSIPNAAGKRALDYAREFGYESTVALLTPRPAPKAPVAAPPAPRTRVVPETAPTAAAPPPVTVETAVPRAPAPRPAPVASPAPRAPEVTAPAEAKASPARKAVAKKPEPRKPEPKKPEPKKPETKKPETKKPPIKPSEPPAIK